MFLVFTAILLINLDVKSVLRQAAVNDTQIAGNRKITSTVTGEFTEFIEDKQEDFYFSCNEKTH